MVKNPDEFLAEHAKFAKRIQCSLLSALEHETLQLPQGLSGNKTQGNFSQSPPSPQSESSEVYSVLLNKKHFNFLSGLSGNKPQGNFSQSTPSPQRPYPN